jgi:hypothetical protein
MSASIKEALTQQVAQAAAAAGLAVAGTAAGADFNGRPTTKFQLERSGQTYQLELSDTFDIATPALRDGLALFLGATAKRLLGPSADVYVTLLGVPLRYQRFAWPFHLSTAGADTSIVHGEVVLADGKGSELTAKIAASLTKTFAEVIVAPEQPYAEGFIYNAVRKVMDQGQLELVKAGMYQPVPVTTRYYSTKSGKFTFHDTDDADLRSYIAAKVFWLSGVLGDGRAVWVADPRDAQYMNTTTTDVLRAAAAEAAEGILKLDGDFARPTEKLMQRRAQYESRLAAALDFCKPKFNEALRHGHSNL